MITLKSPREIGLMREAGRVVAEALDLVRAMAAPGVTTAEIDQTIEEHFARRGATSLFKGYPGHNAPPFPAVTCISINEQIVHGIPGPRKLRGGDVISIDTGCKLNGWCGDAAVTLAVGEVAPEVRRLLDVTEATLKLAIEEMGRQRKWSAVARKMQEYVRAAGFTVVERFVGHGIGRDMHEDPQVPNFVNKILLRNDIWLDEGLVLAIEPMVNMGTKETRILGDHWTVETKDRLPSAHFEHTVALTRSGPQVLTLR